MWHHVTYEEEGITICIGIAVLSIVSVSVYGLTMLSVGCGLSFFDDGRWC